MLSHDFWWGRSPYVLSGSICMFLMDKAGSWFSLSLSLSLSLSIYIYIYIYNLCGAAQGLMCHCLHLVHAPWRQHSWQQLPLTHQPLSERQQSRLRQTDSGTTTSILCLFNFIYIALCLSLASVVPREEFRYRLAWKAFFWAWNLSSYPYQPHWSLPVQDIS